MEKNDISTPNAFKKLIHSQITCHNLLTLTVDDGAHYTTTGTVATVKRSLGKFVVVALA